MEKGERWRPRGRRIIESRWEMLCKAIYSVYTSIFHSFAAWFLPASVLPVMKNKVNPNKAPSGFTRKGSHFSIMIIVVCTA